jgi:hypothetical protein
MNDLPPEWPPQPRQPSSRPRRRPASNESQERGQSPQPPPAQSTEPHPPPAQPTEASPKRQSDWYRRKWVQVLAAGVFGFALGSGTGGAGAADAERQAEVATQQVARMVRERDQAQQ